MLIVNNNCEISRTDHWNSLIFLHVDTNLKRKFLLIFLGVGMAKNWCGQSGQWRMYLKNELLEYADFLHDAANSGKLKVASIIFR